jgi:hypothetical protein
MNSFLYNSSGGVYRILAILEKYISVAFKDALLYSVEAKPLRMSLRDAMDSVLGYTLHRANTATHTLSIFQSSNVFLCRTSTFSLSFKMFYYCKFSSIHHLIPKVSRPK